MSLVLTLVLAVALFNVGCAVNDLGQGDAVTAVQYDATPSQSTFESTYKTFGSHFQSWLNSRGYSFSDGGFGGFRSSYRAPSIAKKVIVFIHGNGSRAHGATADPKGWYNTFKYLRDKGWNNSELYAVNYASANLMEAGNNDHRSAYTNRVKDFINAVYAYTGKKVTVIAHSLGVTTSRKAMKDGNLYSKVETFIAIAGANHGLPTCGYQYGWYYFRSAYVPTCSSSTGFLYPPNYMTWLVPSTSYFIGKLNDSYYGDNQMSGKITRTYVIKSTVDEIAGVRASYTSDLAGAYKTKTYSSVPYGHFNAKDLTASVQYQMIQRTY